jgi:vacuolar-type H+-ATPase subunit E/Vma4
MTPTQILERALEKLSKASFLGTTAEISAVESQAILERLETLQETIEEYHYSKSIND